MHCVSAAAVVPGFVRNDGLAEKPVLRRGDRREFGCHVIFDMTNSDQIGGFS